MTASPPKPHNFDAIPTVHALDEFFHRKYEEDEETGDAHGKVATAEEHRRRAGSATPTTHIHLPSPSYWPIVLAVGLPIIGLRRHLQPRLIAVVGGIIVLLGVYGWAPGAVRGRRPTDDDPPARRRRERRS